MAPGHGERGEQKRWTKEVNKRGGRKWLMVVEHGRNKVHQYR